MRGGWNPARTDSTSWKSDDSTDGPDATDMTADDYDSIPLQPSPSLTSEEPQDSASDTEESDFLDLEFQARRDGRTEAFRAVSLVVRWDGPGQEGLPSYEQGTTSIEELEAWGMALLLRDTSDEFPVGTSEPAYCTPASRPIYQVAHTRLHGLKATLESRVGDEPPVYAHDLPSNQDIQRMPGDRVFDDICGAVRYLDISELGAEDFYVNPRYEGKWDAWVKALIDVMSADPHLFLTSNLEDAKQMKWTIYKECEFSLEQGRDLVRPALMFAFLGLPAVEPGQMEEYEWVLNLEAQCRPFLKENEQDLAKMAIHDLGQACEHVERAIDNALLIVFAKHRIEALLELSISDPALDSWLQDQMRVCDGWFAENETHLDRVPDTSAKLKATWVFSLWRQWEDFLRNGFDIVRAKFWEPPLLQAFLGRPDRYIQTLEIGAYPQQTVLEERGYNIRQHLVSPADDEELDQYEEVDIGGELVEILVASLNDTTCVLVPADEGDVLVYIPPPYRKRNGEQVDLKEVVSRLLTVCVTNSKRRKRRKRKVVKWLTRAVLEGRLENHTLCWINCHLRAK